MKFSCEKSVINEAVTIVQRAAASKSSLPALEGILIETKRDKVQFTAYDLDLGVIYTIAANVVVEGSIVLPTKMFSDIVRKMPDGEIKISTDEKCFTKISVGIIEFTIPGLSAMEYPDLPTIIEGDELAMDCNAFRNLLKQTVFAAAETDERPILQGILFDIDPENKSIRAVAVDGVRLAVRSEKIIDFEGKNVQFVIPRKTVLELLKNLPEEGDMVVNVSISHKHLIFRMEEKLIISRRLEGEFLNYHNAIPSSCEFSLVVGRKELAASIERAALLVSPTVRVPVHCIFDYNMIKVSTATNMGKFYDEFEVEPFHHTLEVGFNHRFMLDALNACEEDEVRIELNNSKTPIVIKPTEGDDFIFLVLPMRLASDE